MGRYAYYVVSGTCRLVFEHLPETSSNTYAKLKEALVAHFSPECDADVAAEQFHSRTMQPNESVLDFANSIESLVARAYPEKEFDRTTQLKLMLRSFQSGLRSEYDHLLAAPKESFAQFVQRARLFEERRKFREQRSNSKGTACAAAENNYRTSQKYSSQEKPTSKIEQMQEQIDELTKNFLKRFFRLIPLRVQVPLVLALQMEDQFFSFVSILAI